MCILVYFKLLVTSPNAQFYDLCTNVMQIRCSFTSVILAGR